MQPKKTYSWPETLSRPFDLIVFDWDGTAVVDRTASAADLLAVLERLLVLGVYCVVITGTKIDHIARQGIGMLSQSAKRNLFIGTNRGSEMHGFDSAGHLQLLHRRNATPLENELLDRAILALQEHLSSRGTKTEIVWNRLNRRKLDLIPTARWTDSKKTEFRELFEAVQSRLCEAGITRGIAEVMEQAVRASALAGLAAPKITSDIKHVEIGLTDKADSVRWVEQDIIAKHAIPHERVLFAGDEFGSVGGITGSDAFMRIPQLYDALFLSVGVEPGGVPHWVIHLGGGPRRFVEYLEFQTQLLLPAGDRPSACSFAQTKENAMDQANRQPNDTSALVTESKEAFADLIESGRRLIDSYIHAKRTDLESYAGDRVKYAQDTMSKSIDTVTNQFSEKFDASLRRFSGSATRFFSDLGSSVGSSLKKIDERPLIPVFAALAGGVLLGFYLGSRMRGVEVKKTTEPAAAQRAA